MTSRTAPQAPPPALGWLLLMPAVFGMLITLVLPTVQTIAFSFRSGGLVGPSESAGLKNYDTILGATGSLWPALGFTLSLTIMPLLVALVVGPLLALALDRAGAWPRRAGRILLALSLVTFSPAAVAVSWLRGLDPAADGLATMVRAFTDPATAPGTFRLVVAAATFGLVCALAVPAFLPALRGGTVTGAMVAVAGVVVLAAVAAGLQTFTLSQALTRGGPLDSTMTIALLQYTVVFQMARLGVGAAIATATGVILGVLGLATALIVVLSGLRIAVTAPPATDEPSPYGQPPPPGWAPPATNETSPYGQPPRPGGAPRATDKAPLYGRPPRPGGRARRPSVVAVAVGVVALLVVTVIAVILAWPWLSALFTPAEPAAPVPSGLRVQLNTWVPALVGALASVGVAYLGALGIGGLRPLGRHSEWLLLPFAPWLLVGAGPLSVANWNNLRGLGLIDTFVALIPPLLISVPALFVLTLLCKGLVMRTDRDFLSGVVLPSLPMAGILAGAVTLVNAQDLLWPLLVAQDRELATAPVAQVLPLSGFGGGVVEVGVTTPLLVVGLALAVAVAAQLLYLDRLAITVGGDTRSRVPAPPA
ncbi:carbohydrate ABC transporter permease [Nonomuraea glycinis]|uniref:carbohydrate ABC transporter permease n=1 Tax=Nonomuraea glycinis TaxID=2047744 RepID=UPI002E139C2F|nr:hypothetical protein OHA68_39430 [Nonomuraea glycinis]